MRRPWLIWISFLLCLAVVLAAMGWASLAVVRLERAEAAVRRQASLEEKVRLALWRLDSALAPLLARESVRPYFAYAPLFPADRACGRVFGAVKGGEALVPSPLLVEDAPYVRVHFQFQGQGPLTSPQVPVGEQRRLAVPRHISAERVRKAEAELACLDRLIRRETLAAALPAHPPAPVEVVVSPVPPSPTQRLVQSQRRADRQQRQADMEYDLRNEAVQQAANVNVMAQQQEEILHQPAGPILPSTDMSGVVMKPLWIDGQLLLARRVTAGGQEYIQGCLLDWPAIQAWLLEITADLLPSAALEAAMVVPGRDETHLLAALPVRLMPGSLPPGADDGWSPILLSLSVAWACMLLAAAAVAGLLAGVLRLSQRRASFVSAVTHELRTPLTTFQMYAEMLAEGMVPDPDQQRHYLRTLQAEAVRLTHLVENVLAYARLERGRIDRRAEVLNVEDLVGPVAERLAARAHQAGMQWSSELEDSTAGVVVRANRSAVEQILFNLLDNACKYASTACDKRIHLTAGFQDGVVELRVRDHGPGISPGVRRRLFRSFAKSAHEAARTAPGVGLGLALSRRLARDMGGDLCLAPATGEGACFVLTLPRVAR